MKKIIILLSFFLSFLMIILPFNIVVSASYSSRTFTNWNSAIVGSVNGDTDYITYYRTNFNGGYNYSSMVSSAYTYSGLNSYHMRYSNYNDGNKCYGTDSTINFNNEDMTYMKNFSMWFYADFWSSGSGGNANEYIYLLNGSNWINRLRISTGGLYIYDGSTEKLLVESTPDRWLRLRYYHITGTNSFYVTIYDTLNATTWRNQSTGTNSISYTKITGLSFDWNNNGTIGASYLFFYFDSINAQYGNLPVNPTSGNKEEYLSQFSSIGTNNFLGNTKYVDKRIIESQYNYKVTTNIRGIDLLVTPMQYEENPFLTNYYLKVNGVEFYHPDYFFNYNGYYVLRWVENLTINNVKPTFEFYTLYKMSGTNYYWYLCTGGSIDVDNDNDKEFRKTNNATFYDGYYNGEYSETQDIIMKWYHTGFENESGECNNPDVIYSDNDVFEVAQPIYLFYQMSVKNPLTSIKIFFNNGTEFNIIDSLNVYSCDGQYIYSVDTEGSYKAVLQRNNINVSNIFNFTVTPSGDNWLFCIPEPSYTGESFRLFYKVTFGTVPPFTYQIRIIGATGYPINDNTTIFQKVFNCTTLGMNYTGECVLVHNENTVITFVIWQEASQYGFTELYRIQHYVYSEGGGLHNYISLNPNPYYLDKDGDDIIVRCSGDRILIGTDNIFICANGNPIYQLEKWGEEPFYHHFDVNVTLDSSYYKNNQKINFTLAFKNPVTTLVLAYRILDVVIPIGNESQNENPLGIEIPEVYGMFAGFLLTITCFLAPLFLTKGVLQFNTFIATVVSLGSGGMGLCASVILGFIPIWVLAFILVLCIFIILIIWLARKIGST